MEEKNTKIMEESTSQQDINNAKELFRRLAHFVTPPLVGGEELPERILQNLIEEVLFINEAPLTVREIKDEIQEKLKLSFDLHEIKRSAKNLTGEDRLVEISKKRQYVLGVDRNSELRKLVKEKEKAHQRILEKFEQGLNKSYPSLTPGTVELIIEDFQTFLAIFFLWSGANAVNLIYSTKQEKFQLLNLIKEKGVFTFLPPRSQEVRKIEQTIFVDFLLSLSSEEQEYLQDLLDKSLEYFTITLDKDCEALMASSFQDWKIFVDTNFLYGLLGLRSEFPEKAKEAAEKLLELGSRFQIKFFVSPETIIEFKSSIEEGREFLKRKISPSLFGLAEKIGEENAVISAYFRERKKRNITVADFLSHLDYFEETLKGYGIKENRDYYNVIKNSGELRETSDKMEELTGKSPDIAEHDSFHFLLVLRLRDREGAGDSFKSNKSWFLTHDHLLPMFDRQVREEVKFPFAIYPYQLRRVMRPLVGRAKDFEAVFIEFVSRPTSRAFSTVPLNMAGEILARISFYEENISLENPYKIASNILADNHLVKKLKELSIEDDTERSIRLINKAIEKQFSVKEEERRELDRISTENQVLKWVIAIMIIIIQVGLNLSYFQSVINFFDKYYHLIGVVATYFLINIMIFLTILAIPIGKKKILKNLDFFVGIYKKLKEIVGFSK